MSDTIKLKEKSVWADAWVRLKRDKVALIALAIIVLYALLAILSALGWIAADWQEEVGDPYEAPSWEHWLGTDLFGRSVFKKVIHGTQIASLVPSLIL